MTLLLILSGCTFHRLDVQTQYLSHENLASYYTGTPDPRLNNPTIGQRLLIQWALRPREVKDHTLFLDLTVRFRNHQEQSISVPIYKRRGFYHYELSDQDYRDSGGVQTYHVEIRNETCVIASWTHPLWVKLISFDKKGEKK